MSISFGRKGHNERKSPTGQGGEGRRQRTRRERRQVGFVVSCVTSDRCLTFTPSEAVSAPARHSFGPGHLEHPLSPADLPLGFCALLCLYRQVTYPKACASECWPDTVELSHQGGCRAEGKQLLGPGDPDSGLAFGASLVILCVSFSFPASF